MPNASREESERILANVGRLREGSFGSDRLSRLASLTAHPDRETGLLTPLLIPHPDDDTSQDGSDWSPRLLGGSEYVQQNIYVALFLLVLSLGYSVERVACIYGLPDDCIRELSFFEVFADLTSLFLFGLALAWLIGINEGIRFRWLFTTKRFYFWIVYLCTPPVYSAISNIDALKFSLKSGDTRHLTVPSMVVLGIAGTSLVATILWHIRAAWTRGSRYDFMVYLGLRLFVLAWFSAAAVVAVASDVTIHLHHLYLGWSLALWCEFNDPFSAITLAIGCGIFVQGVAAYSFAPVFSPGQGCFETAATTETTCRFKSATPFTLSICTADGPTPHHSCE